jgi:hypothetical protein
VVAAERAAGGVSATGTVPRGSAGPALVRRRQGAPAWCADADGAGRRAPAQPRNNSTAPAAPPSTSAATSKRRRPLGGDPVHALAHTGGEGGAAGRAWGVSEGGAALPSGIV